MADKINKKKKIKEEKKEESQKEETEKSDENKQLVYVIVIMAVVLIGFLGSYALINSSKSFEVLGLEFEKIKEGNIPFYYTKIHIVRPTGNAINYNLYLRNDPRTLNYPEDINYINGKITFISIDSSVGECEEGVLAFTNLGSFLAASGIQAKGALTNETLAGERGMPYVTCDNTKSNTVFVFKGGNESLTEKTGENCYTIYVKDCEIIKSVEEIILGTISTQSQ